MAAVVAALNRVRKEKNIRAHNLHLSFTELRERYRFGMDGIRFLCELLGEDICRTTSRNCSLSVEEQVCITLRYLASGAFMQVVGDTFGRDKATVSRVIHCVADLIAGKSEIFIRWPDQAEQDRTKAAFRDVAGFPCVIGLIDGTHVRVMKPSKEQERGFINRKGFPSINVMAVCDETGKFMSINAIWPGSAHDSSVFKSSALGVHLETQHRDLEDGQRTQIEKLPITEHTAELMSLWNPHSGDGKGASAYYMARFDVRLVPEKASKIIMAFAVLHNIAIILGEPEVEGDGVGLDGNVGQQFIGRETGFHTREYIVQLYF
ncbi:putative nuclease HARBI1 [Mya arenaria]|uniref:putative nuclease HARBI1 n=1 Tax=Mya arenaria TaxID=6604 RepID=UPI0022E33984|nr:putative nuclease HARBI1 [Mya arenaria]